MNLEEFIKESLVQISNGITGANEELKDTGALINPLHIQVNSDSSQAFARTGQSRKAHENSRVVEKVEFDIAVSAEKGEGASAGLKLTVASIGVEAGGNTGKSSRSESRIQFSIPVVFPGVDSNT
ncbi:MAG: hypothetical protein OIF55_07780 [Amphritea sp.]|nr:hypothetical protein [Amphritea sp.]